MTPGSRTDFQRKAADLSACVHEIIRCLETHDGEPYQIEYGRSLASDLLPWAEAYDRAVFEAHSREAANEAIHEIGRRVSHAAVSASKGEMGFDFGPALRAYNELHTIFRELRYSSECL